MFYLFSGRQTPPTKCISLSVLSWYGVIPSELWDVPQSFCPKPRHCWNKGLGWEAAKKDVARQHQWWEHLNGWENWMQMIIGENLRLFLLKSAWRGKKCGHNKEFKKQKPKGNCCGQETSRGKAVYPLVLMEATELLRKGTKSAARIRYYRHRCAVTGLPGSNPQIQVSVWALSSPGHLCALFSCPGLPSSCFLSTYCFSSATTESSVGNTKPTDWVL